MKRQTLLGNLLGWLLLMPAAAGVGQTEKPPAQAGTQVSATEEPTYQISERTVRQNQSSTGLSLGILGLYDSNYLGTASQHQGQAIISFAPRLFANVRRRNSLLNLNYQVMYRRYPGGGTADATDHSASFGYDVRLRRGASIRLTDNVRYGPNDIRSSANGVATDSSQQVFSDSQNMLSNSLSGGVSITSGRKSRLDISGSHSLIRFHSRPTENTTSARVRAIHEYQWTKRWYLDAEVSNDWVRSANDTRNASILRFLGGPAFKTSGGWTLGVQFGGDRTQLVSEASMQPSYGASVTKASADTRAALQYWRRSSYQIGLSGIHRADSIVARLDHRFGNRLTINMQTQYYRTFGIESIDQLKTISGGAGFEFAIIPSVLASMSVNYMYQRQRFASATVEDLNVNRYMASIGLYYFYPATKR